MISGHDQRKPFRYAYEPFVFGKAKDKDNRDTYAKAMKYFIIFTLLAFLVVVGYINVFRHFIGRDYMGGLRVVPIVMAPNHGWAFTSTCRFGTNL